MEARTAEAAEAVAGTDPQAVQVVLAAALTVTLQALAIQVLQTLVVAVVVH
jgi:hypothetical protein